MNVTPFVSDHYAYSNYNPTLKSDQYIMGKIGIMVVRSKEKINGLLDLEVIRMSQKSDQKRIKDKRILSVSR
jgi:hypothetical protein